MTIDPRLPEMATLLLQSLASPANQPFARELWPLDIAPWLTETDVPTLVLIGKKDIQVDWQLDGQALEGQAGGNPLVTFAYPGNANHVLKYEPKAREELTPADGATPPAQSAGGATVVTPVHRQPDAGGGGDRWSAFRRRRYDDASPCRACRARAARAPPAPAPRPRARSR